LKHIRIKLCASKKTMTDKYDFDRAIRDPDFERRWLSKFSKCLDEAVGGYI